MVRIDAHNHFWKFDPVRDSWMKEHMSVIRKDFLPADLEPLLQQFGLDGCVAVQADQSEAENEFLLQLAAGHSFIRGIVGWVDLQSHSLAQRLEYYRQFSVIKGFRHILQDEPKRDLMLMPAFQNGIRQLGQAGFTYDILIHADQIGYAATLCRNFPEQSFVIDHIAKPDIRQNGHKQWAEHMKVFREMENVYCKVSGMVTEAAWQQWKTEYFNRYLDTVVEIFGTRRLMFGSDWPVCLLSGSYGQVVEIAAGYFSEFSLTEQNGFFGGNAQHFYNIQ